MNEGGMRLGPVPWPFLAGVMNVAMVTPSTAFISTWEHWCSFFHWRFCLTLGGFGRLEKLFLGRWLTAGNKCAKEGEVMAFAKVRHWKTKDNCSWGMLGLLESLLGADFSFPLEWTWHVLRLH